MPLVINYAITVQNKLFHWTSFIGLIVREPASIQYLQLIKLALLAKIL